MLAPHLHGSGSHSNTPQRPLGHQTKGRASLLCSGVTLGKSSHLKPRYIFSEPGNPLKKNQKVLFNLHLQANSSGSSKCHQNWEPSHQKCGRTGRQGEARVAGRATDPSAGNSSVCSAPRTQAGGPSVTWAWKTGAELPWGQRSSAHTQATYPPWHFL